MPDIQTHRAGGDPSRGDAVPTGVERLWGGPYVGTFHAGPLVFHVFDGGQVPS